MKAIIWNDESLGASFEVTDIPDVETADGKPTSSSRRQEYREELVELAVEQDEDLLMGYLEGEEPSEEDLKRCIRKGTLAGDFVPVLTGTAFKNKGVQPPARRRHRLHALAARRRGDQGHLRRRRGPTWCASRRTTSPSRRSPSRS